MNLNSVRLLLNRCLGRETILRVRLLGQPVRVVVTARREIRRLRKMYNEEALVTRIRAYMSADDILYDIGANVGLISLLLAMHPAGQGCRLHCFEPEPRNFRELSRNIELNGLAERVTPHAMALGSSTGEVELFVGGTTGEGCHSIASNERATHAIRVPLGTVDATALATGQPPDVVKIDVEGAEGQVLDGMRETIGANRVREIFLELHTKGAGDRMPDGTPIHDWLVARGYTLAWESERRRERHRHYRLLRPDCALAAQPRS